MKKLNLMLTLTFAITLMYGQSDYYWSGGKKHPLIPQKSVFVIELEKGFNFESVSANLINDRNVKIFRELKKDICIVITEDTLISAKDLMVYKEFSKAMPAYNIGNHLSYPTGEILLQPKQNISIDEIIQLTNN